MKVLDKSKLWEMSVREYRNVQLKILSLTLQREGGSLLDIGCDDGSFTVEFARTIKAKKLYGIEIHSPVIQKARRKGIIVKKADANEKLPFPDNFFDVIVCNQLVEHLRNPDNLFEEIYRMLKHGGYAIISTPNLASLHNRLFLLFGCQPTNIAPSTTFVFGNPSRGIESRMYGPFRHITVFTYKSLKEMLEHYKLKIDKYTGSGFYPFKGKISEILANIFPNLSVFSIVRVKK